MQEDDDIITIENQVAYHRFKLLGDNNRWHEAYQVFKKTPELINYSKIWESIIFYEEIRSHVGKKEAQYFATTFADKVIYIIKKEMPIAELLAEKREAKELENNLKNLDKKYKKMLEDMANDK